VPSLPANNRSAPTQEALNRPQWRRPQQSWLRSLLGTSGSLPLDNPEYGGIEYGGLPVNYVEMRCRQVDYMCARSGRSGSMISFGTNTRPV
jgi:hypothetical protein